MKIHHNACIDLVRTFLESVSKSPGLSVSEALIALEVASKLMKKGTADIYHNGPTLSDDDLETAAETLYEVLVLSGRKPAN